MLFIPIFKTKENAEPHVIDETKRLFDDSIIPYVELTKERSKVFESLQGIRHFEQVIRKKKGLDFHTVLLQTVPLLNKNNVIVAIHLKGKELVNNIDTMKGFIEQAHALGKYIGIRIESGTDFQEVMRIKSWLTRDDFLIIDIADQLYNSSILYLKKICKGTCDCKVLVFCDERPAELKAASYASSGFNNFSTSLIQSIKDGTFIGDGFGSYCSAKNNLDEGKRTSAVTTYAIFLIYRYQENSFFSMKSAEKDHVSKVYSLHFKKYIEDNRSTWERFINGKTPISYQDLQSFLEDGKKKGNAVKYIEIGMIHYIEEIAIGVLGMDVLHITQTSVPSEDPPKSGR